MALPKRRLSRTRKARRQASRHSIAPTIVLCPNRQELMQPHHICKSCGFYAGKEIIEQEEE